MQPAQRIERREGLHRFVQGFFCLGATAQVLNLSWGLWFGEIFVFFGVPFVALQLRRAPRWRWAG